VRACQRQSGSHLAQVGLALVLNHLALVLARLGGSDSVPAGGVGFCCCKFRRLEGRLWREGLSGFKGSKVVLDAWHSEDDGDYQVVALAPVQKVSLNMMAKQLQAQNSAKQ